MFSDDPAIPPHPPQYARSQTPRSQRIILSLLGCPHRPAAVRKSEEPPCNRGLTTVSPR